MTRLAINAAILSGAIAFALGAALGIVIATSWVVPGLERAQVTRVCDPSRASSCSCFGEEFEWRDGLVFCWSKGEER